jgi:hypothetical protein
MLDVLRGAMVKMDTATAASGSDSADIVGVLKADMIEH